MFYTGKGDDGKTKDLKGASHSKSGIKKEALGTIDELNSFLGIVKVKASNVEFKRKKLSDIIHQAQKDLFIIQAELAGSEKSISEEKVRKLEELINEIEKEIPELKNFSISGTSELQAYLHTTRAVVRRAERKTVAFVETGETLGEYTKKYMNRLSSLMYALARLSNHLSGINEESPDYK